MSDPYLMNRIANAHNMYQRKEHHKRVLCVCSAGLLRSPTAAFVLSSEPYRFNTRAAGITPEFALVPVDDVLLEWADEIVCMSFEQAEELKSRVNPLTNKKIVCLDIPDQFAYRDPKLIEMIRSRYDEAAVQRG